MNNNVCVIVGEGWGGRLIRLNIKVNRYGLNRYIVVICWVFGKY